MFVMMLIFGFALYILLALIGSFIRVALYFSPFWILYLLFRPRRIRRYYYWR